MPDRGANMSHWVCLPSNKDQRSGGQKRQIFGRRVWCDHYQMGSPIQLNPKEAKLAVDSKNCQRGSRSRLLEQYVLHIATGRDRVGATCGQEKFSEEDHLHQDQLGHCQTNDFSLVSFAWNFVCSHSAPFLYLPAWITWIFTRMGQLWFLSLLVVYLRLFCTFLLAVFIP